MLSLPIFIINNFPPKTFCCDNSAANRQTGGLTSPPCGEQYSHYQIAIDNNALELYYCRRNEVYFKTLLCQNNGRQNGVISRKLFSELYKSMVKKVPFLGFLLPNRPPRFALA